MFYLLSLIASLIPDEEGNLIAVDPPLLQMGSTADFASPDYGMAFIKMLLTLIALGLLFSVTIWFLRRIVRLRLEKGTGTQTIRVLEKKMISPKTILYLLEINGKQIAITESQLEVRQLETAFTEGPQNEQA